MPTGYTINGTDFDNIFKPNKKDVELFLFGFIRVFKWLNLSHNVVEFLE